MGLGMNGGIGAGFNSGYGQYSMLQMQSQMIGQNLSMQRLQLAQRNMSLASSAGGMSGGYSSGMPMGYGYGYGFNPYMMGGFPSAGAGLNVGIGLGIRL